MAMHDVRTRQLPVYNDFLHSLPPPASPQANNQQPQPISQSYRYNSHEMDFVGGGHHAAEYRMYPPSPPHYHSSAAVLAPQPPQQPGLSTAHLQQLYPSYARTMVLDASAGPPHAAQATALPPAAAAAAAASITPVGVGASMPGRVQSTMPGSIAPHPMDPMQNRLPMMSSGPAPYPSGMTFNRLPSPFSASPDAVPIRRPEPAMGARKGSKRSHSCMVCGKVFARPSALQTHFYSHTGEKPFKCEHAGCGRSFSVVSNLRRHNQKVHEEKRARR